MRGRLIAAVWLAAGAARALADGAAGEPPAPPAPPASPLQFYARPWAGASLVRLGSFDTFAANGVMIEERTAWKNAAETNRALHSIRWALVDGLEAGYRVDPLVTVAFRIGELRTETGSLRVESAYGTDTLTDEWTWSTQVLMVMGGAGFSLPVSETSRLRVALFLGSGNVTLTMARAQSGAVGTPGSFGQGELDATGTMFVPEFSVDYEADLAPSVSAGVSVGYRFGGPDGFVNVHANDLNGLTGTPEQLSGETVRDAARGLLNADYSGLLVALTLTQRL